MKYYPDNKVNHYVTKLHHDFNLDSSTEWEVALVEFSFTKSWYTISKPDSIITFNCIACANESQALRQKRDGIVHSSTGQGDVKIKPKTGDILIEDKEKEEEEEEEEDEKEKEEEKDDKKIAHVGSHIVTTNEIFTVKLRTGAYYQNINYLLSDYNTVFKLEFLKRKYKPYQNPDTVAVRFRYNETNKKVIVNIPRGYEIHMNEKLRSILGFADSQFPLSNKPNEQKIKGKNAADIEGGIHSLYVYCDLIDSVLVGDTVTPLLRSVEVNAPHGATVVRHFQNPRYLPLKRRNFSTIDVSIKDQYGCSVPFENGSSVNVVLHIRRAKSNYFL
jgi:hypothetical protein